MYATQAIKAGPRKGSRRAKNPFLLAPLKTSLADCNVLTSPRRRSGFLRVSCFAVTITFLDNWVTNLALANRCLSFLYTRDIHRQSIKARLTLQNGCVRGFRERPFLPKSAL